MNTVDVLEAALERLGPEGENWEQVARGGRFGRFCAVGAIVPWYGPDAIAATAKQEQAWIGALADAVGLDDLGKVPRWNDHPARTFSEVRAAFQKAIRNEKAKAAEHLTVPAPSEATDPEPVLATFDGSAPEA